MKYKKQHIEKIVLTVTLLLIAGCIEPFEPDISKYEDALVVDGTFSDLPGEHYVRLARTFAYNESEDHMETGAAVFIRDEDGLTAAYEEVSDGLYRLDSGMFEGKAGKRYQLLIETTDGRHYESTYELLKKAVGIDSLFYEIEEDLLSLSGGSFDGLRIYLNSNDGENGTHYYRWDWTETWEFEVPYQKPGYQNKMRCWKTRNSTSIVIANTLNLKEDRIYRQKLNFISTKTAQLSRIYSINVKQYSLTPEAYEFWRKLELSNEHTGSLFDPPPTPVTGNVENVDDPFEPVLGYFQVSGESEKRIFISRRELPETVDYTSGNEHCESLTVLGEGLRELLDGWYLIYRYEWMDTTWTQFSSHIDCYDCTQNGSNEKPDFWIEFDE